MADTPPPLPPSKLYLAPASDVKNLASLKRLNSLLLPINYRESFYKDILTNATDATLSRVAFWDGGISIVGGIRGRWEPPPSSACCSDARSPVTPGTNSLCSNCSTETNVLWDGNHKRGGKIYLMTICVLSPFRRLGVATALLADIVETAKRWGVEEVYAHVWEDNCEALEWYIRRGFLIDGGVVEGYYRKLEPHGARVVRMSIGDTG